MSVTPIYKRVLIKLSGEVMAGKQRFGLDPVRVKEIAAELDDIHRLGVDRKSVV